MSNLQQINVERFVNTAIECSIYHSPEDPGLTYQEIHMLGKEFQFMEGEINEEIKTIQTLVVQTKIGQSHGKICGGKTIPLLPLLGLNLGSPEYRDEDAFDYVFDTLHTETRRVGCNSVSLSYDTIVNSTPNHVSGKHHVMVVLSILSVNNIIIINKNGNISTPNQYGFYCVPSQQKQAAIIGSYNQKSIQNREDIYRAVGRIIGNRKNKTPVSSNPFYEFLETIDSLKFNNFRGWWSQSISELETLDPTRQPILMGVCCASLVEGALILCVHLAKKQNVPYFQSSDYNNVTASHKWYVGDLVKSANSGPEPILNNILKNNADRLILLRQRIHAGRMVIDYPSGMSETNFRPDEAKECKEIATQIVRAILDWIVKVA